MSDDTRIDRRQALRFVGAAAVTPILAPAASAVKALGFHPLIGGVQGETWQPRLLSAGEVETFAALAETIIPQTDSGRARAALVHQYVDWVLESDPDAHDPGALVACHRLSGRGPADRRSLATRAGRPVRTTEIACAVAPG